MYNKWKNEKKGESHGGSLFFFRTFAKEMIGVRDEGNMSGVRDEEENYFKQIEGIVETKE